MYFVEYFLSFISLAVLTVTPVNIKDKIYSTKYMKLLASYCNRTCWRHLVAWTVVDYYNALHSGLRQLRILRSIYKIFDAVDRSNLICRHC